MKIKVILVLCALFINAFSATAQSPVEFSTDDVFSLLNRPAAVNPAAQFLQTRQRKHGAFAESYKSVFAHSPVSNNLFADCTESDSVFGTDAAPCNGFSVTSISFNNADRTIVSGADGVEGVVYRYANAGTAPDGTVLDALVTVVEYNNNQDADQTTFRDADTTLVGFAGNLQPSINQESGTFLNANPWLGSIRYRIQFVRAGTTTPKIISVAATTIDNDGSGRCGGLRESVTYSTALNQVLTSDPATTQQTISGNTITGPASAQLDIGTGIDFANAALYVNVSEFEWTYSFATSATGACTAGGASEVRYGSLNLSCQINFSRNFASVPVSGNVYNDLDGLTDNQVDGAGTNAGGLFANLLDANNNVVSSVAVAADGTYNFPTVVSGAYNIQISTNQGIESSAAPALALPTGWVSTGEKLGAGTGSDGTVNGLLPVTVAAASITNANFGIEQRPTANSNTAANQTNPGGTNSAAVPATVFSATDPSGGTVSNIRITAFPTGATSFAVGTTTYYPNAASIPATCPTVSCLAFPGGGVTVATNTSGNPTPTISVDPAATGTTTVSFTYRAIDNAGVESAASATASVPFVLASISGTVLNDLNGLTDSIVNGTGTNAGVALYANLLNGSGTVIQRITVPASGAYSFTNLNVGNYTVQISTVQGTINQPAPATTLPTGWVNTGEFVGTAAGNDGAANGLLPVAVGAAPTDIVNANFGIEQRPTANNNTAATQINPGVAYSATVPATTFSASDPSGGTVTSIRITAFPTNATSITIGTATFYPNAGAIPAICPTASCAAFPAGGVTVATNASGNPSQTIRVDPAPIGTTTVGISYVAIDNAAVESALPAATANVPFILGATGAEGNISGVLYYNGTAIRNALVVLIDGSSNAKAFTRTDASGKYRFEDRSVGRTYIIQPLSSKYRFNPAVTVVNLLDNAFGQNFDSTAKTYRPKNDFDGDGKSDVAVYRPADGTWYVLRSSDAQLSSFRFGSDADTPVSGDFDGDGKTDYAVFRLSEGNWYIWQSSTQDLRVERFGSAADKLVPADYDGDGKTDVAVFRSGVWHIRRSSDGAFESKSYGADADTPLVGDFDGDGKSDLSVFRLSEGTWFTLRSSNNASSATPFGSATDVPATGDFDGDGFADIAQFRSGLWFVLNSTTDFETVQLGAGKDQTLVGDYDGDGRADQTVFRDGSWSTRSSGSGKIRNLYFGSPTDVLIK